MDARETDVNDPQDPGIVEGLVDNLAGNIVDMIDGNPDPDFSATVSDQLPAPAAQPPVEGQQPPAEGEQLPEEGAPPAAEEGQQPPGEEQEMFTIKWQGQEKDVTLDEIVRLAQQGFDYSEKTRRLKDERDSLAPFMGLAQRIQADPVLANTIAAYLQGQPQQPQQQRQRFADPVEQLKWEAKEEAKAEMRQEMAQQIQPMQKMQVLNSVKAEVQRDPDYPKVHQAIVDMVASQPPALQRTLYLQLDQDPQSYMEAFQYYKKQLSAPAPAGQQPQQQQQTPVIASRRTKAPILEGGGLPPADSTSTKDRQARLSRQKVQALRSGDPLAIADWLEKSGAIDHLY